MLSGGGVSTGVDVLEEKSDSLLPLEIFFPLLGSESLLAFWNISHVNTIIDMKAKTISERSEEQIQEGESCSYNGWMKAAPPLQGAF